MTAGILQVGNAGAIPSGAGSGNVEVDGALDLGPYDVTVNGLTGCGTIFTTAPGTATLTVGDNDQTSQFDGLIDNGWGSVALTKLGDGTFTLGGENGYSAGTTVSAGVLEASLLSSLPLTGGVSVEGAPRWPSPTAPILPPCWAIRRTSPTKRARSLGSTPAAATSRLPPTSAPATPAPASRNSAPGR